MLTASQILTYAQTKSGKSRKALARQYGISHSQMCRWVNGEHSPKFCDVVGVVVMLGFDLKALLDEIDGL